MYKRMNVWAPTQYQVFELKDIIELIWFGAVIILTLN